MLKHLGKKSIALILLAIVAVSAVTVVVIFAIAGGKDKNAIKGPNGALIPQLSNPDAVFYDGATYDVTYGEVYDEFKINDGINQLLYMVDEVLLSSYLAQVTQEEIVAKIKFLKHGSDDDAVIAEMDPDTVAANETNYDQNMFLLGYSGQEEDYIKMVVAKEKFTVATVTDIANKNETWYVGDSTIATYYEESYYDDLQAIKIRFFSETDAKTVMKSFNLVSYKGTIRLYTGTRPIDQVSTTGFNDTNTRVMTDVELINRFLQMYNYVYGSYRDTINVDASIDELLALESLTIAQDDVYSASATLSTYLFETLNDHASYDAGTNTSLYYTYQPAKFYGDADTATYLILKLTDDTKADLTNYNATTTSLSSLIGTEIYETLKQEMIDTKLATSGFVSDRIAKLRADRGFIIYDYYLGVDYQSIFADYVLDETGSTTVVAKLGEELEITTDEYLSFSLDKNGSLYALYAAQVAVVMDQHYEDVYCPDASAECVYSIPDNVSSKMAEHRDTLAKLQTSFEDSYYVYYYTFEEYIYLAYGAKSNDEMLTKYYVKSTLQPYLIYDEIKADNWALLADYLYDLVLDYYNNYFSLDAKTLLIFIDRDENGDPDDYAEFITALGDTTEYDALLTEFETAIRDYFTENPTTSYTDFVTEYNLAKRTDAVWGEFKQYGFGLNAGDPSSSGSITYLNTIDTFEDALIEGFKLTYAEYNDPANIDKTSIIYSELVESSIGLYLIYAEKGTAFTKPSAQFTMTYDTNGAPNYTVGSANDSAIPSIDQLKLYAEQRFYEIVYGNAADVETTYGITIPVLPTSVLNAMKAYFTTLHDSMYVVGFLNIVVAEELGLGTFLPTVPAYTILTDATIKANLITIRDIYFAQVFAQVDTIDEE